MASVLIIGASGGIGSALARPAEARGDDVIRLSRSEHGLDVTDEMSVAHHLGRVDAPLDVLIIATGALEIAGAAPEKALKQLTPEAMLDQFRLNTLGPALCLKHALPKLRRDGPARAAVLSARVGSISDNRLGGWHSYRVAKAGVNQVVRGAAIELARTHKDAALVALHPGTVATRFAEKYLARHPAIRPDEAATHLWRVIDGLTPNDSGKFFDYSGAEVPW
ncbi:MAG: SDR family NAD(P)-dependent oxidoreductase [Pseudomonadota bacterium]